MDTLLSLFLSYLNSSFLTYGAFSKEVWIKDFKAVMHLYKWNLKEFRLIINFYAPN